MGKAFVAKLAKEGARDPQALAAWIGRKKHGGKAFGKLAAAGRKNGSKGDAKAEPPRPASQSPEERRAAGIAAVVAHQDRQVARARQENAERRQRNAEALARINDAPGRTTRKAMTKEERNLVNYEANGAALYADQFERLRPFADESAQTNRVDVLKARAFQKARAERIKNGWSVPGEPTPTETGNERPASDGRAGDKAREQASPQDQGFTEEEERQLAATAQQTARMNMGQLQAFEQALKPTATRTRREALQHEAVRREIARRHDAVREGMNQVRKMNQGAGKGSFMMGQRPEGVSGQRLRRMSDDDVNRNLQITVAVMKASEEQGAPMSREDKSMLFDVMSALRRENSRRGLPPVR